MKKIIILTITASLLMTACEDILDIKPTTFVSDALVWENKSLIDQFVANTYGMLITGFNRPVYGADGMGGNFDSGTDDFDPKFDSDFNRFNTGEITASNCPCISDIWIRNYTIIRKCNIIIEGIINVKDDILDAAQRKRYKAEAHFLRAFCYFDLAKTFGKAPLIDHVQKLDEELLLPPAGFEEIVNFIEKECDTYAGDLYSHKSTPAADKGHATKGAFMALKAKALLYLASPLNNPSNDVQRWTKAANAADDVRKLNEYSLYRTGSEPYYTLFTSAYDNNDEFIFAYRFHFPESYNDIHRQWITDPVDRGGWNGLYPTQNLADAFENKNGELEPYSLDDNMYADRDARLAQTLLWHGCTWETTQMSMHTNVTGSGHGNSQPSMYKARCGYGLRKFLIDHGAHSAGDLYGSPPIWAQANNWPYFRYAEILLNYAEAKNESSGAPDQSVYDAVNEVRSRVGQPGLPAGLTQEQMRDRIKNERRVELVLEEHRFFDLRRWKDADILRETIRGMFVYYNPGSETVTYSGITCEPGNTYVINDVEPRVFNDVHYFLPIPQSELDKNPLLEK